MSLEKDIQKEMVVAMKAKDKETLAVLRSIKSAILLAKTEAGAGDELSDEQEIKLLTKQKKQRMDSATIFREQDRVEMAEEEEAQARVIDRFLPQQLSESEVKSIIEEIIAQTSASGMKDMGKVMGLANKKMAGKADGKTISGIVKGLLGGL